MRQLHVRVGAAIRQPLERRARAAVQEPPQPVVTPLQVVAREPEVVRVPRIDVGTAAPVHPALYVLVVVDVEIVAQVLDGAPVQGAIAHDLADADARSQHAAPPPRACILKEERQPEHRHVIDVQHTGASHGQLALHHLQLARAEVVMGNRVVAGGDGATAAEECGLLAGAVVREAGALRIDKIFLPTLDRRAHVSHRAASLRGVVVHGAARHDVGAPARRITQHVLRTARTHDLAGVVVDDRVADHDRLVTSDRSARTVVADQGEDLPCGIEGHAAALKPGDCVPGPREQRVDHGIRFGPLHDLALCRIGRNRIARGLRRIGRRPAQGVATRIDGPACGRRATLLLCGRRHRQHHEACGEQAGKNAATSHYASASTSDSRSRAIRRRSLRR